MAKKFSELRAMMTPESQARAEAKAQAMLATPPAASAAVCRQTCPQ